MDPTAAFLLGALVASTKGLALLAAGFGIGWWRARARLRRLEEDGPRQLQLAARLDRLENAIEYMSASLDRLGGSVERRQPALPSATTPGARAGGPP